MNDKHMYIYIQLYIITYRTHWTWCIKIEGKIWKLQWGRNLMNLFSSTTFYRRSNIHTSHIYYERSNSTSIVMDDGDLATKIFYISQSIEFLRAITCISFTSYIYYIFVSEYSISTMIRFSSLILLGLYKIHTWITNFHNLFCSRHY